MNFPLKFRFLTDEEKRENDIWEKEIWKGLFFESKRISFQIFILPWD